MSEEKLAYLARHNRNLVKTAARLRADLKECHGAMCVVIDLAEPIAEQHEDVPSEYIIHADNINDMRRILIRQKNIQRKEEHNGYI